MNIGEIIGELERYRDQFGLVQPEPDGRTSHNGVRFTCEAIVGLLRHPLVSKEVIDDLHDSVTSCQQGGVLLRWPRATESPDSIDNYIARMHISCVGYCVPSFPRRFLEHGRANKWFFYGPGIKSFLGRFPHLIMLAKNAVGEDIPLWMKVYATAVVWIAANKDGQDEKVLSWHLVDSIRGEGIVPEFVIRRWERAFLKRYPGGIGQVLAEYFDPEHDKHPLSKLLWGVV